VRYAYDALLTIVDDMAIDVVNDTAIDIVDDTGNRASRRHGSYLDRRFRPRGTPALKRLG
jgi:hypothetical protein